MRKKCNAIGQERTVMIEAAPTWRKGAVTCQGDIAAFKHIIRMHKTEIKDVQINISLNFKHESLESTRRNPVYHF